MAGRQSNQLGRGCCASWLLATASGLLASLMHHLHLASSRSSAIPLAGRCRHAWRALMLMSMTKPFGHFDAETKATAGVLASVVGFFCWFVGVFFVVSSRLDLDLIGVPIFASSQSNLDRPASPAQVGTLYDPMVAKLVCHGPDRASALARLHAALGQLQVRTNQPKQTQLARTWARVCPPC